MHGLDTRINSGINETRTGKLDKNVYRLRNHIESFSNRMKHYGSITARYDKFTKIYQAYESSCSLIRKKPIFKITDGG